MTSEATVTLLSAALGALAATVASVMGYLSMRVKARDRREQREAFERNMSNSGVQEALRGMPPLTGWLIFLLIGGTIGFATLGWHLHGALVAGRILKVPGGPLPRAVQCAGGPETKNCVPACAAGTECVNGECRGTGATPAQPATTPPPVKKKAPVKGNTATAGVQGWHSAPAWMDRAGAGAPLTDEQAAFMRQGFRN